MEIDALDGNYLELRFGPRWTYISCVRRFVASFFMIGLADKERAEQISMAASELLENAVKYAAEAENYLRIVIHKESNMVEVCVRNAAEPAQINNLRREVAYVNSGEPEAIYLQRMEESARTQGKSRLGLPRIVYEGRSKLRLEVSGKEVAVYATFSLEDEA